MTTKEIRKALKAGKKLIFNRHIHGAPHGFERLPVLAVKYINGLTWIKVSVRGHIAKPAWAAVHPELDDYVSVEFPPVQPVTFGGVNAN